MRKESHLFQFCFYVPLFCRYPRPLPKFGLREIPPSPKFMPSNRQLRRKPPPPLETDSRPAHYVAGPLSPFRSPELDLVTAPAFHPFSDSLDLPLQPSHSLHETSINELLLLQDSPHPKGPKELPFDEISPVMARLVPISESSPTPNKRRLDLPLASPNDSPSAQSLPTALATLLPSTYSAARSAYRTRRFQHLLLRGTAPFVLDSDDLGDDIADASISFNGSLASRPQPPYPLSVDNYSGDSLDESSPQHRYPTTITPTRIPPLADRSYMQKDPSPNRLDFFRAQLQYLPSGESSPDLPNRLLPTSALSSPTKHSLYRSSTQNYDFLSQSKSSRSPSPQRAASKIGFYPAEENYLEVFDEYYNEERAPRWSLIEHDDLDEFSDPFLRAPPSHFDYSILPELPTLKTDVDDQQFLQEKNANYPRAPLSPKKFDALPPVPLDLPLLPFSPTFLSTHHFVVCENVWSVKKLYNWCLKLSGWIHEQTLAVKDLRKILIKLIGFHRQDIPIDLISRNVTHIISLFDTAGILLFEDSSDAKQKFEQKHFHFNTSADVSGVLVDLTPCYCYDEDHRNFTLNQMSKKCYSSQCHINKLIEHEARMKNTDISELILGADWASHWKLTVQDMAIDMAESKRQSLLFDLIKFEQTFIQRAECFLEVAGPEFLRLSKLAVGTNPAVSMITFEKGLLESAGELSKIHRSALFLPLLQILISDGKFIKDVSGMASLYAEWARLARKPLLKFIQQMPTIEDLLSNEALKKWDEGITLNPRMKELQVNGNLLLMSTFNSRYQQLPLQLLDIRKFFDEEDEEFDQLTKAVDAIRKLGTRVNEMKVHADNVHALRMIEKRLQWKSSIYQPRLNLASSRRKFYYRGDLVRKGDLKINSSAVHLIVLDNYILITDKQRYQRTLTFKVCETPIPIDYLIVENREKEQSGLSGIVNSAQAPPNEAEDDTSTYPFKIRFAGRGKGESHTLVATSDSERQKWISVLVQAKANAVRRSYPEALYHLKLIDNAFFAYEFGDRVTKLPVLASSDPVNVLAKQKMPNVTGDKLVVHKQVLCSEMFNFMNGQFHFLGTNSGVYCSDEKNIWKKIVNLNNVVKVTVVADLNVVLVSANKTLRYYPLQLLINIYYEKKEKTVSYQLSNEAILFYEFGWHRGVPSIFVAKRKNLGATNFKVYVMEKDNNGIFSAFTVNKRFYIQAECYGISIFNSSIAVHTLRGFEVLDLNKLSPRTIPELPAPDASAKKVDGYSRKKNMPFPDVVRKAILHVSPLGMFRLSNKLEFLLVYSECAIFVSRSGKLSRSNYLRFAFRPQSVAFLDDNLFLVCEEVVEVWAIDESPSESAKLVQVLPYKDVHMLNAQSLCLRLANPRNPDSQIVLRMTKRVAVSLAG